MKAGALKEAGSVDLETGVLAWLQTQGYPFEMRVAKIFRDEGWQVDHGRAYIDPAEGKVRPIDLIATVHRSVKGDDAGVTLTIVAECKKSIDPWVVFTAPRDPDTVYFPTIYAVDRLTDQLIWEVVPGHDDMCGEWLSSPMMLGHGVVRVPWSPENDKKRPKADAEHQPYAALQSVLSASTALGVENREALERDIEIDFTPPLELVFPVVVVDAKLFTFELSKDGSEKLSPTDIAKVYMPDPKGGGVVVPVMTPIGLTGILATDTQKFVEICNWLSENNAMVRENLFGPDRHPNLA